MSDVDENGAAEQLRWHETLTRIEAGRPALWCDSPLLSRTEAAPVHGELRFEGWAVSPGDIDSVTVEVAGRGSFAARTGRRRPDAHKAFYPARWARRPGFKVAIPTTGWLPGILDVTITARDRHGGSASLQGRVAWQPDGADLAGDLAAGLPALWVGEPAGSASEPLSDAISVRGWVSAREGVESVEAELEGLEPARTFLGEQRYEPQDDLPRSYFAIVLDARTLDPAQRTLTVRAFAHGGSSTQRSGPVLVDPAARYRRRLAENAPGASQRAAGPGDAVELHVLVTGGVPGDALLASLDAQERAPADVTTVDGALDGALDRLLSAPGRVGVLVAGGDSLAPHALATVAAHFEADEPPDLVYSDHDTREAGGDRSGPVLKPGWSPELLLSRPYVGSFLTLGSRAAEAARRQGGSLRSANSLLLALADEPLRVVRVPEVLWSREPGDFPEVSEREDAALDELATRRGSRLAITERDPVAGVRRVEWMLEDRPSVSVVIPTSGREDPLSACLRSLVDRTAYPDLDVVLVDSGGGAAATAKAAGADARVVRYEASEFNFSRACNVGAAQARGDFVAFVNDDIEALGPDWLTCLVAQAQLPNTGIVGAKLIYPGGLVQHAGLFLDRLASASDADLVAAQFAFHQDSDDIRLMNLPRDCSAVTGACLLMRREVLADLGGWDEGFRIDFGDVDLCLRAIEAGRRVVVEPRARLLHHVHATQGQSPHDEDDARRFLDRWATAYADGDPWYHPACVFGRDWEIR